MASDDRSTRPPSTTLPTPWWENVPCDTRHNDGCSYSTVETYSCSTVSGEGGKPEMKCNRIRRRFRQCPGRPVEQLEVSSQEAEADKSEPFMLSPRWPGSAEGQGGDGDGDAGYTLWGALSEDVQRSVGDALWSRAGAGYESFVRAMEDVSGRLSKGRAGGGAGAGGSEEQDGAAEEQSPLPRSVSPSPQRRRPGGRGGGAYDAYSSDFQEC